MLLDQQPVEVFDAGHGTRFAHLFRALTSSAIRSSEGRHYVTVDEVTVLVEPVLAHRLALRPEAAIQGLTAGSVLSEIVAAVPVPRQRL